MITNNIVGGVSNNLINPSSVNKKDSGSTFEDFYNAAMSTVNNANNLEIKANKLAEDFIAGKHDNIHSVVIAQEKANIAIQFTSEVRNKVLDAYNEIMRMQV
ncbi:MAG: flagellar hook-basal body complex protein FliE [Clostridia bacterium]|jgi:flagellar hook-basal body complex protein FliE|nr:flagellar hook-basal body complex protein FliE [Clostridia bacterium]